MFMRKGGVAAIGAAIGAAAGYIAGRVLAFGEPALVAAVGAVIGSLIGYRLAQKRENSVESTDRTNAPRH
jgi:membrane protein YqaA with SNARE-associated domain